MHVERRAGSDRDKKACILNCVVDKALGKAARYQVLSERFRFQYIRIARIRAYSLPFKLWYLLVMPLAVSKCNDRLSGSQEMRLIWDVIKKEVS